MSWVSAAGVTGSRAGQAQPSPTIGGLARTSPRPGKHSPATAPVPLAPGGLRVLARGPHPRALRVGGRCISAAVLGDQQCQVVTDVNAHAAVQVLKDVVEHMLELPGRQRAEKLHDVDEPSLGVAGFEDPVGAEQQVVTGSQPALTSAGSAPSPRGGSARRTPGVMPPAAAASGAGVRPQDARVEVPSSRTSARSDELAFAGALGAFSLSGEGTALGAVDTHRDSHCFLRGRSTICSSRQVVWNLVQTLGCAKGDAMRTCAWPRPSVLAVHQSLIEHRRVATHWRRPHHSKGLHGVGCRAAPSS